MRYTFHAYPMRPDGSAVFTVEFGNSASETTAARIALRAALKTKGDTCVVKHDAYKHTTEVVQRVYLPHSPHGGKDATRNPEGTEGTETLHQSTQAEGEAADDGEV